MSAILTIADAIAAVEAMDARDRDLPCPGCPSTTAIDRLALHRHVAGAIEATAIGAVRWFSCVDCGAGRVVLSAAAPFAARAPEGLPC